MTYTVGQLKKLLEMVPDEAEVCIERIEDVYFEKHGWTTERVIFQEIDGVPYDYNDYTRAHCSTYLKEKKQLIILAHY